MGFETVASPQTPVVRLTFCEDPVVTLSVREGTNRRLSFGSFASLRMT
jgi:hypothetical protein